MAESSEFYVGFYGVKMGSVARDGIINCLYLISTFDNDIYAVKDSGIKIEEYFNMISNFNPNIEHREEYNRVKKSLELVGRCKIKT